MIYRGTGAEHALDDHEDLDALACFALQQLVEAVLVLVRPAQLQLCPTNQRASNGHLEPHSPGESHQSWIYIVSFASKIARDTFQK